MKRLVIMLFMLTPVLAEAQSFVEKTNRVKLDYTRPMVATTLPTIVWITPRIERSNSMESSVMFEAVVHSDVPFKELKFELIVGGETRSKSIPVAESELTKNIQQTVRLQEGENVLKLIAINTKGGQVSSERSILVGKDAIADAVDINRRDFALIVTTDNYDNWNDLVNPINDGRTIGNILKDKYGFQVEFLENPTLEDINDKLYDYNTKRFAPQDQLFIFFAGHGYFDETLGEGYLVASNSLLNDKGKTSYIPHPLLRERINNIKCEHIFLVMDVCFGGTFDPVLVKNARGTEALDEAADKQYLVRKLTKRTRKYLTSGSKEYVPDGTPGKHSPFAEKFILALKEIGGGTGRVLSLIELHPYFLRLSTEPRFGSFGNDDSASDFVFVAKQ
ncbi:MAG TPA: caspase family protein [Cyclobacteriaceae bacterium]|nr:caspase family protein [Cyclobacteriaceae bacterium]